MFSIFNNLSFRNKLILITLPMFLGNLMWGNLVVWEHGKIMYSANGIHENLHLIDSTSQLISEVQKERNISILFLDNSKSKDDLEKQRQKTDLIYKEVKSNLNESENILKLENEVRKNIDTQANKKEVYDQFTKIISMLTQTQIKASSVYHLNGIESNLLSLNILENAKEDLWKLRIVLIGSIKNNKPISNEIVENIQEYKTAFSTNLTSLGLQISDQGSGDLKSMLASKDWLSLKDYIEKTVEKASSGNYGVSTNDISTSIESIDSALQKIIVTENNVINKKIDEEVYMARIWFFGASGFLTFATIMIAILLIYLIRKIITDLQSVTTSLVVNAENLNSSSENLTTTSSTLSISTNQQASALQETASAIHEVTSTIEQNSLSTNQSRTESNESTRLAKEGQKAIDEMVTSIHKISDGNQQIMQAVEQGNNEIAQIVKVIEEIGGKTKVINDIVFQTKLLSFNASVEAARAGEHGKGFAVVAEEVGNLAEMSGNAAKEISNMLDESIRQVQEIVDNTKSSVGGLVEGAKDSLNNGVNIAERCKSALDKVLSSVQTVDTMISSIAVASAEQATGVGEINKAITQLDHITHKNAQGAQECATAAMGLASQSQSMKLIARDLRHFINGGSTVKTQSQVISRPMTSPISAQSKSEQFIPKKEIINENKQVKLAELNKQDFVDKAKDISKPSKSNETNEFSKIKVKSNSNMPKKSNEIVGDSPAKMVMPARKEVKEKIIVDKSVQAIKKTPTNDNTISVPDANDSRFEDV